MFLRYVDELRSVLRDATVTDGDGAAMPLEAAVELMGRRMRAATEGGNKILFVGNGGSAGICSHMATDYSKNGGMPAMALNDGAALTCLGNDYGYAHVFEKQIEWHGRPGDVVVAISSSGQSENIVNAVSAARARDCIVYTLSGFSAQNPLRRLGDLNIYLDSGEYGFVETGHLTVLHGVLDLAMGWTAGSSAQVAIG